MAASADPLVVGRVIGDVVDMFVPTVNMSVYFGSKHVTNGCDIKPSMAFNPPRSQSLVLTDPDAPSPSEPSMREWVHWIVADIPGGTSPVRGKIFTSLLQLCMHAVTRVLHIILTTKFMFLAIILHKKKFLVMIKPVCAEKSCRCIIPFFSRHRRQRKNLWRKAHFQAKSETCMSLASSVLRLFHKIHQNLQAYIIDVSSIFSKNMNLLL